MQRCKKDHPILKIPAIENSANSKRLKIRGTEFETH